MIGQLIFHILFVVLIHERVFCEEHVVGLDGSGWIRYQISTEKTRRDKVTLSFRTMEPFGMLMYSCGDSSNDFLLLEIKRGRLV